MFLCVVSAYTTRGTPMNDRVDWVAFEREIVQRSVNRHVNEGLTGCEAFQLSRRDLSLICEFQWHLIHFDEVDNRVVPLISSPHDEA